MEEKNELGLVEAIKEIFTGEKPGNAIWLLKQDHRKVEELFKDFESSRTSNQRYQLIQQIIKELDVHTRVEEKVIYPILAKEDKEANGEANEEHHVVKLILAELAGSNGSESNLKSKVKVLCEIVKHHVKEEEGGIFQTIERSGADMDELGQKIVNEKNRLLKEEPAAKKGAKKPLPKNSAKNKVVASKSKSKAKPAAKSKSAAASKSKAPASKKVAAAKKTVATKKPAARRASKPKMKKAS